MMPLRRLTADCQASDVASALATDGAVIIDELVSPTTMGRIHEELAPHIENTPFGPDEFSGAKTRRTGGLIARSPTARDLVMHALVLEAVGLHLSHATSFRLHLTQLIAIGPDQPAQPIHRDQWAFDFFDFPAGFEVQLNTLWALTDFTEENGATRVILGSNHAADKQRLTHDQTTAAEMKTGSVLVYTGSVYHGGGANRTDEVRMGVNITYALSWLRQEENQYLSCPPEVARDLPVDLLRLMGYARGAYALGYVDDLRDPIEVVRSDAAGGSRF